MGFMDFFMKKNAASDIIINRQPFYDFFSVFYHYGLYAVELFFMISGFIFFYLYADNIHSNKTSAKTFIVNRVSRLYPLYIFTFAVVAILQIIFFKSHNYFLFILWMTFTMPFWIYWWFNHGDLSEVGPSTPRHGPCRLKYLCTWYFLYYASSHQKQHSYQF